MIYWLIPSIVLTAVLIWWAVAKKPFQRRKTYTFKKSGFKSTSKRW